MAAQRLTRSRFIQITLTLTCLISAFIWGTYRENLDLSFSCIKLEVCEVKVGELPILLTKDAHHLVIKTTANRQYQLFVNGVPQGILTPLLLDEMLKINVLKVTDLDTEVTVNIVYEL
jgi:hypothetical protein